MAVQMMDKADFNVQPKSSKNMQSESNGANASTNYAHDEKNEGVNMFTNYGGDELIGKSRDSVRVQDLINLSTSAADLLNQSSPQTNDNSQLKYERPP